jgi:hypothetical protein
MPFFERRQGDRRSGGAAPGQERRGKDRRQWAFGVLYRTAFPLSRVEEWLELNAKGRWAVALEDIGEGFTSKTVKVSFELEDDKNAFVAQFGRQ